MVGGESVPPASAAPWPALPSAPKGSDPTGDPPRGSADPAAADPPPAADPTEIAAPAGDAAPVGIPARTAAEIETEFRERLLAPAPAASVWGWLGPLLVAAVAGALRLIHLGRPHELVFDETYYVKQAYSLLRHGFETQWAEGADEAFARGDVSTLLDAAAYVVHPPLGKWLIAAGIQALGVESAVGWRISGALVGAGTVWLLARIARRLFSSTLLGCVAGLLLAVDGSHLVLSRTGILDVFVAFFALAAFGAVVLDRERSRARLARLAARDVARDGFLADPWGPRLGVRWWLVAAGVLAGLGMGVKWSGIYVLAVLGLLTVAWDIAARRGLGVRLWVGAGVLRDGPAAALALLPVAALAYLGTWTSWFIHPGAYLRQRAAEHPGAAPAFVPDALASWWEYHRQVWKFHHGLTTPHSYEAQAPGWILQWRPTLFFWADVEEAACSAERCVQAITSVGNPIVWWAGAAALVVVGWGAVRGRDWRAWTIVAGYAALWLPWFAYPNRTTFTFYAVALAPFVALSVTYLVAALLGWSPETADDGDAALVHRWRSPGYWVAATIVLLALAAAWFFWPVWTAATIPYEAFRLRTWLPSWF